MVWYECRVSYPGESGRGQGKMVTERYLVEAASPEEAEARIKESLRLSLPDGFTVSGIRRSGYSVVIDEGKGDWFYSVHVLYFHIDGESGEEKRTSRRLLLRAPSLAKALALFDKMLKKTPLDYKIVGVEETQIADVFRHDEGKKP